MPPKKAPDGKASKVAVDKTFGMKNVRASLVWALSTSSLILARL
jgi:hypothetical protein